MEISTLAERAEAFFEGPGAAESEIRRPIEGLVLLRCTETTPLNATLYEPVVCLILQGQKETSAGIAPVQLKPGQSLVVSHDLPVTSRITLARADEPYLAMVLTLDVALLRSLYDEVGEVADKLSEARALAVHEADPQFIGAFARYLSLASNPLEARVLLPMVRREIHFRLLMAPHGGMLRRLLRHDSHASNVSRAIAHIRSNFRGAVPVPELARVVGMSPSSLHKHFKRVTSTTPLQYQKELRLLEAKRLLGSGADSVSNVAYSVGYESPNQFSREYARKFGVSPRSHLGSLSPLAPRLTNTA